MTATNSKVAVSPTSRKDRPGGTRPRRAPRHQRHAMHNAPNPAAGAHAAIHLINEDATPGAGALPSYDHASGREVDGGAG